MTVCNYSLPRGHDPVPNKTAYYAILYGGRLAPDHARGVKKLFATTNGGILDPVNDKPPAFGKRFGLPRDRFEILKVAWSVFFFLFIR